MIATLSFDWHALYPIAFFLTIAGVCAWLLLPRRPKPTRKVRP